MKPCNHWAVWFWAGVVCLGGAGGSPPEIAADDAPRWRWSNPHPHGNNIVAMTWSPAAGYAVQVTERGGIYTSHSLEHWTPRDSATRRALRSAAFFGSRLVITGESGTVLYADEAWRVERGEMTDGPTDNWLEAVAVSETLAVAVGDNGAVYASEDGVHWRREQSGVTGWLRGVTFGNDLFVAVGEDGTIIVSADGEGWVQVDSQTTTDLNRVAYIDGTFIAVGDEGLVRLSNNGIDWVPHATGATGNLYDVTDSPAGWLVVGDGECRLHDGNTWHDQLADPSGGLPSWTYYTAIAGPDWVLAAGRTGVVVEGRQTGPGEYEWTMQVESPRHWLFDMARVNHLFVAVGDRASVMTSSTGVDWSIEVVPESLANSVFLGVGGSTNLLVAAGSQGSLMISPSAWVDFVLTNQTGNVVTQAVNTLGIVWHPVEPRPTTLDLQGVAHHGERYYVVGESGVVLSSADGTNWTERLAPTTSFLSGITGFEGGLVATGEDGALFHSSDGEEWVAVDSGTTNWIYRVRNLNGQLLAVGQNGILLGSVNGLDWSPRNSGTDRWLQDVSWIDGRFFAVGTGGTVLASSDSFSWTQVGSITHKTLSGAAADGQRLVVVGVEGVILRSPIVPDLTPIVMLDYLRHPGSEPGTVQNLFLIGGKVDQRFTLDSRPGLGAGEWSTGPVLEFFDSSGTLFYLETGSTSTAPSEEFYRGTLVE